MIELSAKTKKLLEAVFSDNEMKKQVATILIDECGDNVPFCEERKPEQMERIRFSVLKLSEGDFQKFKKAVELAKIDWRDLFMAAGFGQDLEAHNKWYEQAVKK